jgi:peptidoglycan/LPS O-acetylase OafA/YrhL
MQRRAGGQMQGGARWSGLDGLRAVAVVAVAGNHFGFLNEGGAVGVDLFFVLSGFLITSLLLREHQKSGAVSLRRFWLRRGLRLVPALVCAVLFALVVAQLATPAISHATWSGAPWVFLYVGNWVVAAGGQHSGALGLLEHTWSLAIEEQFYLVWPLVLSFWLGTRAEPRRAAKVMAALAVLAGVYNLYAWAHWGKGVAYFRTDAHAMGLCAGCALALAVCGRPESVSLSARGRRFLQVAALGAFALFGAICVSDALTPKAASLMLNAATLSAVALVACVVLVPESYGVRLLSRRGPSWLGARSYGIYLYHYPLAVVLANAPLFHFRGAQHTVAVAAALCITVIVAAASYRWIESPFLRLKERTAAGKAPAPQSQLAAT